MHKDEEHNGRARINNLRGSEQAKQILEEIKKMRAAKGKYQSLSSLWVEAIYGYYTPELKKIKSKLRPVA